AHVLSVLVLSFFSLFSSTSSFFFQAEDGIRDFHVTGVQTCALPIWSPSRGLSSQTNRPVHSTHSPARRSSATWCESPGSSRRRRSEERRVGKECRSRLRRYQ